MINKIYKNLILVSIFIFFGLFAEFVYSVGSNLPITTLPVSQSKYGGLSVNKLFVGNLDNPQKIARITTSGWLGLGLPNTGDTNPNVPLDVRGLIRLSELKESGRQVCANKDGDIVSCGFMEFSHGKNCIDSGGCNKAVTTHEFKVPTGVSQIQVEIWGSGGMGYFYGSNSSTNKSPDSYNNCLSGGNYYCPDGGSSFFYGPKNSGAIGNLIARAYGGDAPTNADTGGSGGSTYINTSNTKVSNTLEVNGGNGGGGENPTSSNDITITCDLNNYNIDIGGNGGNGGSGGGSGSDNGNIVAGGLGGRYGLYSNCEVDVSEYEGLGYYGEDGNDGVVGTGGSGAGGHGGSSQYLLYDPSANYNTQALKGFSGGGGAGYVKFNLDVSPGEIYTIKLSRGGEIDAPVYGQAINGVYGCDSNVKWTCFINSRSGYGGGGFTKISY